ncbi:GNAT family N-acetyltransferase [Hahella ganghwensis]|uniref:GNAT family N-acetyltransferase n=1 Tax=Hahella ganghwensis TaxID=286420 RepID=UPI0003687269|nr:GNAT family N-acetyltransferase [Hahella ganghwensis]
MESVTADNLTVSLCDSLDQVDRESWNRLNHSGNPFCRYEFLAAMETSRSVTASTGWQPRHLLLWDGHAQLVGAIPTYLKSHSYGEYVFDWAWADAYHRHGLEYYPKLLSAIPFTPSVGPRLLLADNLPPEDAYKNIVAAIQKELVDKGLSGWHLLFPDTQSKGLENAHPQLLRRQGTQFHWHNRDYKSFEDFLGQLTSRKRKNIRKERRRVSEAGVSLHWYEGKDISDQILKDFYPFYQMTYYKRGQNPYLTPQFFKLLREQMPENMLILMAEYSGRPVAGSLFFKDDNTLYGRYWGCVEDFDQLHFECCYYQGIDYAIEHHLRMFDAGAQGEHKILRGFEPVPTYSLHWIQHPQFRHAIADFLRQEKEGVEAYMADASTILPYRQTDSGEDNDH